MPEFSQGDIFTAIENRQAGLAVIFGHIGFNQMHLRWVAFSSLFQSLAHIHDPFSKTISCRAHKISEDQWLWFVSDLPNYGMSDEQVISVLESALAWAKSVGVVSVITNGIPNIRQGGDRVTIRARDKNRAQLLANYVAKQERDSGFYIELISTSDVFVRHTYLPSQRSA